MEGLDSTLDEGHIWLVGQSENGEVGIGGGGEGFPEVSGEEGDLR